MKGISDFLAQFKVIPNPRDEKKIIAEIVSEAIGQPVPEESVEVKGPFIFIDLHPMLKTLIFQRKIGILDKINTRFNKEKTFKNVS